VRRLLTALTTLAALGATALTGAAPASAITNGELDGNAHPYVGLMVATDDLGRPMWPCTGTLVSPTLFVTAGHCTDGAAGAELWFGPGPYDEHPLFDPTVRDACAAVPAGGYPCAGDASGTAVTHPSYDPAAPHLADLGVVVLDELVALERYASLPTPELLEGRKGKVTFTTVGYGQQRAFPGPASWKDEVEVVRMSAQPRLIKVGPQKYGESVFMVSANARTGGTCYGDSGGPMLLGDVLVGVTSFGINVPCAGQTGAFRLDSPATLTWLTAQL
jgi:Trypsin